MSDAALPHLTDARIAVIGLGYVGLPLAAEFGKSRQVVGFDIDESRIAELRRGEDRTRELSPKELDDASLLQFSNDPGDLEGCDCFIVTVPTPLDRQRRPDLGPLLSGARTADPIIPDTIESLSDIAWGASFLAALVAESVAETARRDALGYARSSDESEEAFDVPQSPVPRLGLATRSLGAAPRAARLSSAPRSDDEAEKPN